MSDMGLHEDGQDYAGTSTAWAGHKHERSREHRHERSREHRHERSREHRRRFAPVDAVLRAVESTRVSAVTAKD